MVVACSSAPGSHGPTGPPPTTDGPSAQAGPSEAECDQPINHAVALGVAERSETMGGGGAAGSAGGAGGKAPRGIAEGSEPPTTQADHEAVRRKLHEDFLSGCRALPREAFRCALAARSLSELASCQPSASSSTSNSSVAPGGMTPP